MMQRVCLNFFLLHSKLELGPPSKDFESLHLIQSGENLTNIFEVVNLLHRDPPGAFLFIATFQILF